MEQNSSIFNFKLLRSPIIIIALYVIIELGFRISSFGAHTALNWGTYNPRGILSTDIVMAVENPEISWKLRPGVETIFKNQKFTTNSLGLRNPEVSAHKLFGKTRVIVLGRSITMGAGVSDEATYTRRLQQHLEDWKPGQYEVLNCAVGGYSLKQMLNYYEEYLTGLNTDILLIPLSKEDLLKSDPQFAPPLALAQPSISHLNFYLSYTFLYESLRFVVKRTFKPRLSTDWKARASEITDPQAAVSSNKLILAAFIHKRNLENISCLLYSPDRGENPSAESDEILEQWTNAQTGASYLDINEYMQGKMPAKTHIYFGDNHPSPEVHALFADALFLEFKKRYEQQ